MHAAAYHIPHMVTQHNNLKQFSGQGTVLILLYNYMEHKLPKFIKENH